MVEVAAAQYQHVKLDDVAAWNGSSVDWTNAANVSSCILDRYVMAIRHSSPGTLSFCGTESLY